MPFRRLNDEGTHFQMLKLKPWQVARIDERKNRGGRLEQTATMITVLDENTIFYMTDDKGETLRWIKDVVSDFGDGQVPGR